MHIGRKCALCAQFIECLHMYSIDRKKNGKNKEEKQVLPRTHKNMIDACCWCPAADWICFARRQSVIICFASLINWPFIVNWNQLIFYDEIKTDGVATVFNRYSIAKYEMNERTDKHDCAALFNVKSCWIGFWWRVRCIY